MTAAEQPAPVVAGRRDDQPSGLHQPWRGLVALGELVLAAAAVLAGVLCWHRGFGSIVTPIGGGRPPLVSTVLYGNWAAGAIGLCVLGAFLVLDAVRQLLLAVRTRRRPLSTEALGAKQVDDSTDDDKQGTTGKSQ